VQTSFKSNRTVFQKEPPDRARSEERIRPAAEW
jgi:hypothetical protein